MRRSYGIALAALVLTGACSKTNYKYVAVQEPIPAGKTDNLSQEEQEVEQLLQKVVQAPIAGEYFGKMFGSAVLVLKDFDNLTFTVHIKNGVVTLVRGTEASLVPEFIIPLRRKNCENLLKIVEDGKIDDEEALRIHCVTYVAGLRAIFRVPALYNEWVAKQLALPPFMHMSLKSTATGFCANATVVNVNGQWLVFDGLLGDPDVKLAVTHEQTNRLLKLIYAPLPTDNQDAVIKRITDVKSLLDSVTVYRKGKT